ncbi:MAG: S8 family serine peptidase, partial [Nitrosopumilaceae archaeon]
GTLLFPIDPEGNYFGVMYDFLGHGTSSAASITSKGTEKYDIYGNSTKYSLKGVAPGAKIVPIKALWFGDAVYAWLWASGFHQENSNWIFEGKPRVDIISNSWGVSNFPTLQSVPGLDVLSLILSTLTVPGSIDRNYPGVLIVSSAGNAGHGYGTMGLPNAAPYGLSVGATTNNVYVGYGSFKNQPRFGNTTTSSNEIADFSSRGPGIIGDPKPDLMSIGAYSFTPSIVTKKIKNATDPFTMFGGTSMAGPLVSGSAAILMESMKQQNKEYDPFKLKNILMSTATDLESDPFTQGSGIVNVENAVNFVKGKSGTFIVYNNASYANIKKILDVPMNIINSSSFGIENLHLSNTSLPMTPWFGGRLYPGERTFATFTIENPTNRTLDITIKPQILELVKKYQYNGTTEVRLQDPLINKSGIFRPNYIPLEKIIKDKDMTAFFEKKKSIPNDASLMIINVNFPFDNFMNKTEKIYANDMKISSVYLYDWHDKNNDTKVTYDELSLVNRGGSWGTVQELRVAEPNSKFKNVPLVGVYPVPTKYSYWIGDTKKNSTSMDYTVTTSFYKKENWDSIWVNYDHIEVQPNSSSDLIATLIVPQDSQPGVYQGFISFQGILHEVNVPISYAVTKGVTGKDLPTVIKGSKKDDTLYGNGYIGGGFDMANRYNAGDWRQYYFDVQDKTINSAALNISWENKNTNLSVFVIDPAGRIVQTNVPPGVLGHFQGWPTGDWLGTSPFSEGGGFFPIKNKDDTSTVLYAPINQTGTYSVLMHSTLFGGQSLAEPMTVTAKFSTILPDEKDPQILFVVPEFINSTYKIQPEIIEENIDTIRYSLDGNEIEINSESSIPPDLLTEGDHTIKVSVSDTVGHRAEKDVGFKVDNKPPEILIKSPTNGSLVSNIISIDVDVSEQNLPATGGISILLPNGTVLDKKFVQFDTRTLENGESDIWIFAKDLAGNEVSKKIIINIDNRPFFENSKETLDQNFVLLQGIIIGIVIATAAIILATKTKISKKH